MQKRVIRLNKDLFKLIFSINELVFEPSIEYQNFERTAVLHLIRKKFLFVFIENLKVIKKLFDNIS